MIQTGIHQTGLVKVAINVKRNVTLVKKLRKNVIHVQQVMQHLVILVKKRQLNNNLAHVKNQILVLYNNHVIHVIDYKICQNRGKFNLKQNELVIYSNTSSFLYFLFCHAELDSAS